MNRSTAPCLAFLLAALPAAAGDPSAFTLDESSVKIVNLGPAVAPCRTPSPKIGGTEGLLPELSVIANIGQKMWKIILNNKPVADVKTQYATALPKGVKDWADMAGWKPPKGTVYRLTAKNIYGATVVDIRYQVLRTTGGSYKGAGQYLTAVAIEPLLVEVAWGYRLSMEASIIESSIVNVGTSENPVAAMTAELAWRISTPVKDSQGKAIYYLQGNGIYQEIGAPFGRAAVDASKARIAKASKETLTSRQ